MRKFLSHRSPKVQDTAECAHAYQPDLIRQLKDEHRHLLALHDEILQAFGVADYQQVMQKLIELRTCLQTHLLAENECLYCYLEHHLADDAGDDEVTRRFHREMEAIGTAIMEFLNKYNAIGVTPAVASTFAREYAKIGRMLAGRIEKEELILYPLYLP